MARLQEIRGLAEYTAKDVSSSPKDWMKYLDTAAKLYRYPFSDTLLIHAQRPDATACVSLEAWNQRMGRWVNRGAKGIALIDDTGPRRQLRYVFDVSDTHMVKGGRTPNLWQLQKEQEEAVLDHLADAYGLEAEQLKDDDYRRVIASMLRVADFGIQSLQVRDSDPIPSKHSDIFTNIDAVHTVQDIEGNTSSYTLNMTEESDGTNSYFKLIGIVKKALDQGTLLVADEMDAHLHPLLTKHLVSLFNSAEFNPNGAQLIFTSHNTNLLDLDVLRRDQIWFTEKDEQTAATDLFSLYDFSIRKDAKVEKGYLIGRYGAIPFIKGGM